MKWKKILISTSIGVAAATPLIAMLVIGANPRLETASSTFLMDFSKLQNNENTLSDNFTYSQKNDYLNSLKKQVNDVFNEYKKQNPNPELVLDFRTLKSSMTPGELNYFTELKKAMLGINENLSINLIPRSPVSVQEGFYQRNSDMVSFYWSPDYNDIGTWLTYMFADFQIANMWPAISSAINGDIMPSNLFDNPSETNWVENLANRLQEAVFLKPDGNIVKLVEKTSDGKYKALTNSDVMKEINNGLSLDTVNTTIGNIISSWISSNESIKWEGTLSANPVKENGFYDDNGGFVGAFVPSMQTNFLDFLSSYNPNIPNFQDGPNTRTTYLVRDGFHVATNPNGTNNYRDWYSKVGSKSTYIEYMNGSPFDSSVTSLNPAFTKTSSATFFQTVFSTLFSWSVKHDYTSDSTNDVDKEKFDVQLVSQGSKGSIEAFKSIFDSAMSATANTSIPAQDGISAEVLDYTTKSFKLNIPIRPIPWVNASGQITNDAHYLSPIDFLVGLASYKKCLDVNLNSNSYFIDLIGLNIEETLKALDDSNNYDSLINKSTSESKNLTLVFNNPQLSSNNIADILSIQYFSALPHFSEKVQNILKIDSNATFNPQGNEWNQYYGAGYQTSSWQDCWYTTPYYISRITDQYWEMELNQEFFKMFVDEANNPNSNYVQFNLNPVVDKLQYQKIKTLRFFYNKSGFQEQTLFEMFKSGEADKSLIPSSALTDVERDENLKNQIYAPEVLKISKSDLIPYNLQVYMKHSNGVIRIVDSKGNEVDIKNINSIISSDRFGNITYSNGYRPMLKSNIDDAYYDLIVKNFYTPIDAKDENGDLLPVLERSSAIIRTAINDCINWLSLSAIVNPTQSKIMQNSFFPYGSSSLPTNNGTGQVELAEDRLKYWNLAAYKMSAGKQEIGLRMGGILEWSILDYYNVWKSSISNNK
ncbi:MAG: hypothetical protein K2L64_00785 [Ureaplasma sp.]|nr:hypothetical protein [Ureaplasma sp.]